MSEEQSAHIRKMFGRIAGRYDLLNRLMTFGQDQAWRRETVRRLETGDEPTMILDVGAGTGDLAFEITGKHPKARVVACDLTPEMVAVGRKRGDNTRIDWVIADALRLPFAGKTFDGVVSGFLLRNVPEVHRTLGEQHRVLRRGGRLATLDTTPLGRGWLRPLLEFHQQRVIPFLGRVVAGNAEAYRYLPRSTAEFMRAEALAEEIQAAGLKKVGFVQRGLGTIAIHWGEK